MCSRITQKFCSSSLVSSTVSMHALSIKLFTASLQNDKTVINDSLQNDETVINDKLQRKRTSLKNRLHLTTTTSIFYVVRNGLLVYRCYCSHLTTKTKWCIIIDRTWRRSVYRGPSTVARPSPSKIIVVNGTHFYRHKIGRQVRTVP